jgi:hypothetical protein
LHGIVEDAEGELFTEGLAGMKVFKFFAKLGGQVRELGLNSREPIDRTGRRLSPGEQVVDDLSLERDLALCLTRPDVDRTDLWTWRQPGKRVIAAPAKTRPRQRPTTRRQRANGRRKDGASWQRHLTRHPMCKRLCSVPG